MYYLTNQDLYHHGILGMKWGIRRYQPYPKGSKGGKEIGEAAKSKNASKEISDAQMRLRKSSSYRKGSLYYYTAMSEQERNKAVKSEHRKDILKSTLKIAGSETLKTVGRIAIGSALTVVSGVVIGMVTGNPVNAVKAGFVGGVATKTYAMGKGAVSAGIRSQSAVKDINAKYKAGNTYIQHLTNPVSDETIEKWIKEDEELDRLDEKMGWNDSKKKKKK